MTYNFEIEDLVEIDHMTIRSHLFRLVKIISLLDKRHFYEDLLWFIILDGDSVLQLIYEEVIFIFPSTTDSSSLIQKTLA